MTKYNINITGKGNVVVIGDNQTIVQHVQGGRSEQGPATYIAQNQHITIVNGQVQRPYSAAKRQMFADLMARENILRDMPLDDLEAYFTERELLNQAWAYYNRMV